MEESSNPKKIKLKIPVQQLVLEFFSILVAISLALMANEWRQERNNRQLVARLLETIKTEIAQNKEGIQRSIEYRGKLVNDLQQGKHRIARFPYETRKTKNLSAFKQDLYTIALQSGADLGKDFDLVPVNENTFVFNLRGSTIKLIARNDSVSLFGEGNIQLRTPYINNTSWEVAQATQALVHMDYQLVELLSEVYQRQKAYLKTSDFAIQILYTGNGSILSTLQDMYYYENILFEKYNEMLKLLGEDIVSEK
jgi:hypothetical protein